MAGRNTLFTKEVADGIVLALRTGVPMKVAGSSQGISETTLYDWLAAGEGRPSRITPTPELSEFSDRVRRAKAEAHLVAVGTIRTAIIRGNWQAALAWIKLRYPQHYAERMEVTGAGGGPVAIQIAQALEALSEDELASIEAHLAAGPIGIGPPDGSREGTP